jgi:hypothetical protein
VDLTLLAVPLAAAAVGYAARSGWAVAVTAVVAVGLVGFGLALEPAADEREEGADVLLAVIFGVYGGLATLGVAMGAVLGRVTRPRPRRRTTRSRTR